MGPLNPRLICVKIVSFIHYVSVLFLPLFTFIFRFVKNGTDSFKEDETESNFVETEYKAVNDIIELKRFETDDDDDEKEEKTELSLKFKFPTLDEFSKTQKETGNIFNYEVAPKFDFTFDEMKPFHIGQSCFYENEEGYLDMKIEEIFKVKGGVDEEEKEIIGFDLEENGNCGEFMEFQEKSDEKAQSDAQEEVQIGDYSQFSPGVNGTDSGSDSASFDGFLSDSDLRGSEGENEIVESNSEVSNHRENPEIIIEELDDEEISIIEELNKLEEVDFENHNGSKSNFLSEDDFNEDLNVKNEAGFVDDGNEIRNVEANYEKSKDKESSTINSEDPNKLESLWEHQELIEQLKMELKKVKATGLPTILEEFESPKITDDLKPWKIDEKFHHEDCIGELHKFYKSYRERMRKFDILNYQKMYAMGFLQLKDPLQSISTPKQTPPSLKSLVSHNHWLFKHKVHGTDPMKKFIQELQGDLEVVYVGQMCLSWEFLHWQHDKALDLWDSDPRGVHRYNEVAGEFQQFQVLMQRFIEDEPFQGPRVQHYVKSRCVLRNLLQVPVIREDNLKYKRKARTKEVEEYVIRNDMLVEIVEESIRIFWRFVRADKDCTIATINGHKKTPEVNDPEDLTLLLEVRKVLQKKEKKLKDLLRSENCILRKFRRHREEDDDADQVLNFFSQVDMKLVSRVLNMSKVTREQLIWCQNKLNRIRFVNRKIYVEPAFLLFPC